MKNNSSSWVPAACQSVGVNADSAFWNVNFAAREEEEEEDGEEYDDTFDSESNFDEYIAEDEDSALAAEEPTVSPWEDDQENLSFVYPCSSPSSSSSTSCESTSSTASDRCRLDPDVDPAKLWEHRGAVLSDTKDGRDATMKKYTYPRFDPLTISRDSFFAVNGKRRSGKTWFQLNLLYSTQFRKMFVIAGGQDGFTFWRYYVPNLYILPAWNEPFFQTFVNMQELMLRLNQFPDRKFNFNLECAVLLTDLSYDESIMRSKVLQFLAANGRRLKVFLVLDVQYIKSIRPKIRTNIDYLAQFKEQAMETRKMVYALAGAAFHDEAHFHSLLSAVCVNHRALVIANTDSRSDGRPFQTHEAQDQKRKAVSTSAISHFKARTDIPQKWMGCAQYQLLSLLYYRNPDDACIRELLNSGGMQKMQEKLTTVYHTNKKGGVTQINLLDAM